MCGHKKYTLLVFIVDPMTSSLRGVHLSGRLSPARQWYLDLMDWLVASPVAPSETKKVLWLSWS